MAYSKRDISRMFTVDGLARRFSVPQATTYRMAHKLPMVRVGRRLKVSKEAIEEALKANGRSCQRRPDMKRTETSAASQHSSPWCGHQTKHQGTLEW